MSNIVIYSTKPMPELQATLMDIDEAEVRVVSIDKMKDYAVINPSLIIVCCFQQVPMFVIKDKKSSVRLSVEKTDIFCNTAQYYLITTESFWKNFLKNMSQQSL